MSSRLLASLLFMALLLPVGGAALAAPSEQDEAAAWLARAGQTEGLTGQVVFQLLLGEVALQRGQVNLAVSAYQDLALRTRDPAVVKRAVELAGAAQQYGMALELARIWVELEPESQQARQSLAGLLVMAGRIDELDGPISQLLAADPASLGANFLDLNRLLARHPDKPAVLAFVERMAQPYPTLPEAYYAIALAAFNAGQLERARFEVRRAQKLKPEWEAPVLLESQIVLKEAGEERVDEAVRLLSDYLQRHPGAVEVRLHLARVLIGAKRYPEARQQFDALLKLEPDNPEVVYPVAMLALQEQDLETARRQFSRLLELPFPDRDVVRYFLGQIEEAAGDKAAALQHYKQVEGGAQYLMARGRGAQLLVEQGKRDEALAFLRQSTVRTPQEKVHLAQMQAQLLREGGQYAAAYATLAAALKLQPEQPDLLYDTSLAAEKLGKFQEMETLLKKLIKLQPDNAHAYNALGYSLADRNLRLKEAHELIQKATSLAPQDPFIMDSLGWVLYRQGKLQEAREVLEKAYALKADAEIAAHLGEVLWRQGRHQEALELWQKAQAQAPHNETLQAILKKFKP
ncbi:MAG: tetratricopeptide repeat protein [Azovibrio sp.]|uniref:tetratricopeptide repeat protein n=1 Tax=Azovibrio sp. TaxID=1872673 RepID=UPI003C761286